MPLPPKATEPFITSATTDEISGSIAVDANDVVLLIGSAFGNNGAGTDLSYTVNTDSKVPTWNRIVKSTGWGFGQVIAFWGRATSGGTLDVTLTEDIAREFGRSMILVNIGDEDRFLDQWSTGICEYTPDDYPTHQIGNVSGPVTLADSLVFAAIATVGLGHGTLESETGDIEYENVDSGIERQLTFYAREAQGPGNTFVKIRETGPEGSKMPLIVFTFSKPLTNGPASQYAIRGGCGFDQSPGSGGGGEYAFYDPAINRPLRASLPYLPPLGSTIIVCAGQAVNAGDLPIQDAYGNTYTPVAGADSTDEVHLKFYSGTVDFLPPVGEVFAIEMDLDPASAVGTVYQHTSLGIVGYNGQISSIMGVSWDQRDLAAGIFDVFTEALNPVPAGAKILGMAHYACGAADSTDMEWTELDGYAIKQSWEFPSFTGQINNRPRIAGCVLVEKTAPSTDSYIVSTRGTGGNPCGIAAVAVLLLAEAELELEVGLDVAIIEAPPPPGVGTPGETGPIFEMCIPE